MGWLGEVTTRSERDTLEYLVARVLRMGGLRGDHRGIIFLGGYGSLAVFLSVAELAIASSLGRGRGSDASSAGRARNSAYTTFRLQIRAQVEA